MAAQATPFATWKTKCKTQHQPKELEPQSLPQSLPYFKYNTSMTKTKSQTTIIASLLLLILILLLGGVAFFNDKIFPGIAVASTPLTGLTREQASTKIAQNLSSRASRSIIFDYNSQTFSLDLSGSLNPNLESSIAKAWNLGRAQTYLPPKNLEIDFSPSPKLNQQIDSISSSINKPAVNAQIKIDEDSNISITPSSNGEELDKDKFLSILSNYLNTGKLETQTLPVKTTYPNFSYQAAINIKKTLDTIKASPLTLRYGQQSWTLNMTTLLPMIDLEGSRSTLLQTQNPQIQISGLEINNHRVSDSKLVLKQDKLDSFLKPITEAINRPVKEPLFQFDGAKVVEFQPPQVGLTLNQAEAISLITTALRTNQTTPLELPVEQTHPKNKLTNDLGIKELIGQGISHFTGSIANRIYNIKLASSRINGILIPPGETFSFVSTVGDISASSGYKQAYVIKSGRTVLDDGGGVCQVSTTVFRAALNSGLPITGRVAHAYRVGYYEQGFPPGLDATIFSPSVDFKLKNDTSNHVLIQSYVQGSTLFVDLYGSKDGRVVTVTKPVVTDQTPPPPPLYQDDPTIPKGTTKQVDWAAWGAKVSFKRTVTKDNQVIINDTFRSNFRPWQAVYLVGTQ